MATPQATSASKIASPRARAQAQATQQAQGGKSPSASKQVFGLHVGLNYVNPVHYQGWDGALSGCVPDAKAMQAVAGIAGARGSNSILMLDKNATTKAFIAAMIHLSKTLRSGDDFYLSFSGHGGSIPDISGDEPDRKDETWCFYDRQLIDDELFALFGLFAAGVTIIVCSDSCHSGTATKAGGAPGMMSVPPGVRSMPADVANLVYLRNNVLYDQAAQDVAVSHARAIADGEAKSPQASTTNATVLLLSGCQDNQYSMDGTNGGLFTQTLLSCLRAGQFKGTYYDLHKLVVQRMPAYQTPNLYIYGRWSQNARYLPAFPRKS